MLGNTELVIVNDVASAIDKLSARIVIETVNYRLHGVRLIEVVRIDPPQNFTFADGICVLQRAADAGESAGAKVASETAVAADVESTLSSTT